MQNQYHKEHKYVFDSSLKQKAQIESETIQNPLDYLNKHQSFMNKIYKFNSKKPSQNLIQTQIRSSSISPRQLNKGVQYQKLSSTLLQAESKDTSHRANLNHFKNSKQKLSKKARSMSPKMQDIASVYQYPPVNRLPKFFIFHQYKQLISMNHLDEFIQDQYKLQNEDIFGHDMFKNTGAQDMVKKYNWLHKRQRKSSPGVLKSNQYTTQEMNASYKPMIMAPKFKNEEIQSKNGAKISELIIARKKQQEVKVAHESRLRNEFIEKQKERQKKQHPIRYRPLYTIQQNYSDLVIHDTNQQILLKCPAYNNRSRSLKQPSEHFSSPKKLTQDQNSQSLTKKNQLNLKKHVQKETTNHNHQCAQKASSFFQKQNEIENRNLNLNNLPNETNQANLIKNIKNRKKETIKQNQNQIQNPSFKVQRQSQIEHQEHNHMSNDIILKNKQDEDIELESSDNLVSENDDNDAGNSPLAQISPVQNQLRNNSLQRDIDRKDEEKVKVTSSQHKHTGQSSQKSIPLDSNLQKSLQLKVDEYLMTSSQQQSSNNNFPKKQLEFSPRQINHYNSKLQADTLQQQQQSPELLNHKSYESNTQKFALPFSLKGSNDILQELQTQQKDIGQRDSSLFEDSSLHLND